MKKTLGTLKNITLIYINIYIYYIWVTATQLWNNILGRALHKRILMEKSSLSSQNFNQSLVKILSIHKTNWTNKEKAKEKCDRRRLREIVRTLQRWRIGLKVQGRSGRTLWEVNSDQHFFIHSLTSVPIIQSCPVVNEAFDVFVKLTELAQFTKWFSSLIWRSIFIIASLNLKRFINCLWGLLYIKRSY